MKATFTPLYCLTVYAGKRVLLVASTTTLAARNSKSAPSKPSPSRSPSGWLPPFCIRSSSSGPSSNSWLPTPAMSSPMRFIASMVGSSWNSAEMSGEAPIRSPAETITEFEASASAWRM